MKAGLLRRMLDVLNVGVMAFTSDLESVVEENALARRLVGKHLDAVREAMRDHISTRTERPGAVRLELPGLTLYLRVVFSPGDPPLEVLLVTEEVLRDGDLFRQLSAQYGVTRREFQVLAHLRLGKTNKQIAGELGLSATTIAHNVERLLERFEVPNRTSAVNLVEALAARRR